MCAGMWSRKKTFFMNDFIFDKINWYLRRQLYLFNQAVLSGCVEVEHVQLRKSYWLEVWEVVCVCSGINKLVWFHKLKQMLVCQKSVCVCTVNDNTVFGVVHAPIYVAILFSSSRIGRIKTWNTCCLLYFERMLKSGSHSL